MTTLPFSLSRSARIAALITLLSGIPLAGQTASPADDPGVQAQVRLFSAWLESQIAYRGLPGVVVGVVAGDLTQVAEVHSGRGYQSQFGMRLHFGLGDRDRVDQIEVRWPGGNRETFTGTTADQRITLKEGSAAATD